MASKGHPRAGDYRTVTVKPVSPAVSMNQTQDSGVASQPPSSANELLSRLEGHCLWLTLNRPEALNALSAALCDALAQAIDAASVNPEVRVIVLTGAGRAFCAGADLKRAEKRPDEGNGTSLPQAIAGLMDKVEACSKPVIAAVNGLAIAGGLELLLACDLVVAQASARFGDGHSNWALVPAAGGTARLPRRVGVGNAKYIMFTANLCTASRAFSLGLVHELVEDGRLQTVTSQLAQQLALKSPLTLARMKALLNDSLNQSPEVAMRRERAMGELHAHSFDQAEGLAAFREKREPKFQGR